MKIQMPVHEFNEKMVALFLHVDVVVAVVVLLPIHAHQVVGVGVLG